MKKKKRHIGLKIFLVFLLLLLIGAVILFIKFYPIYQDAGHLAENLDLTQFTYELEVELNREELQESQRTLLDALAEFTGVEQENMYHLRVQGSIDRDVIYAVLYPQGQSVPLTELYLSDRQDVVNCAMLYNAIYAHYESLNPLVTFLPVWNDHEFVSLEQMEQMMQLDLKTVKNFELPFADVKFSAKEIFVLLAVMEREKQDSGCTYGFRMEGLDAELNLNNENQQTIKADLAATQPKELVDTFSEKLSKLGVNLSGNKPAVLDSISVKAVFGEGSTLQIPDDLISQDTVDTITKLRGVIKEISGK